MPKKSPAKSDSSDTAQVVEVNMATAAAPVAEKAAKLAKGGKASSKAKKQGAMPKKAAKRGRPARAKKAAPAKPAAKVKAGKKGAVGELGKALKAKIAEEGLSTAAAARAIGVNPLGLARVLAGKSKPNARTAPAYAKWLGQSIGPAAVPVKSKRRGRPPGKSKGLHAQFAQVLSLISEHGQTEAAEHPVLADQLAMRIHGAGMRVREVVERLLKAMG